MARKNRHRRGKKMPRRTETNQPGLSREDTTGRTPCSNGIHCLVRNERIDTAVCIVQQSRHPDKCRECGHFRKER